MKTTQQLLCQLGRVLGHELHRDLKIIALKNRIAAETCLICGEKIGEEKSVCVSGGYWHRSCMERR